MLQRLYIKNYALIDELDFSPSPQFNTITGETGAGKSIMLGALGLLLGQRADVKSLLQQDTKCIVEATFQVNNLSLQPLFQQLDLEYDDECIIRREIHHTGKSRAFVNDSPVILDVLKQVTTRLIDVHSQHENLLLHDQRFVLHLLDEYANNRKLYQEYVAQYTQYIKKKKSYEVLKAQVELLKKEQDYKQFLLEELERAEISIESDEKIEVELQVLENAEEIAGLLQSGQQVLSDEQYGGVNVIYNLKEIIKKMVAYSSSYQGLEERVSNLFFEMKDLEEELVQSADSLEVDNEKLERLRDRSRLIFELQHKHQVKTVDELIEVQEKLSVELAEVSDGDESLQQIKAELQEEASTIQVLAESLSKKRQESIAPLCQEIKDMISALGIPKSDLTIEVDKILPTENGIDQVKFLFSANQGMPLRELKKVASGGEFSRLMFSIKAILARSVAMPTIVFDEIDTGISGEVANKMSLLMKEMGTRHQVITITHLPQVAARGQEQFFVYKDQSSPVTTSKLKRLPHEEREVEIAKMISGDQLSEAALQSARELLQE